MCATAYFFQPPFILGMPQVIKADQPDFYHFPLSFHHSLSTVISCGTWCVTSLSLWHFKLLTSANLTSFHFLFFGPFLCHMVCNIFILVAAGKLPTALNQPGFIAFFPHFFSFSLRFPQTLTAEGQRTPLIIMQLDFYHIQCVWNLGVVTLSQVPRTNPFKSLGEPD